MIVKENEEGGTTVNTAMKIPDNHSLI